MECKICNQENDRIFEAKILSKYVVKYYYCSNCGFLQTEKPYWLKEAYEESINLSDTGLISRNIKLSKISSILFYFLFNRNAKFLDFAGGYGVFVRIMRDYGFDFYWNDPYTPNLVARGFEYDGKDIEEVELVTCFETLEHFDDPLLEFEKILSVSSNILCSTYLLPKTIPMPNDWWYYGLEHGQHIALYSLKTLEYIAKKHNLNLVSNGLNLHLFTKEKINPNYFKLLWKLRNKGLFQYVVKQMRSLTISDMNYFKESIKNR